VSRLVALGYGLAAYLVFLATFLLAIHFVGALDLVADPPVSIDGGVGAVSAGPLSWIVDLGLLALFAIQHSVMARPAFKRWWTRFVPVVIERSTYVLVTSLILLAMIFFWQPLPAPVWDAQASIMGRVLQALFWAGWLVVLLSTFLINHFDLFGVRQVWLHFRGLPYQPPSFRVASLYRYVRHPIMLGLLIAFWATPYMTVGHLLFAVLTTAYVLVAIQLEERDLVQMHGDAYRSYRQSVSMLLPLLREPGATPDRRT
jgi:protein-S-isoprenylcysteine O-methyltransferase Ste14